ncbi:hypothetical protein [Micromonospora sp. URMC 103]|uniref:hypothetical protein n=1 Tax=Micromonospora sp. URMC 103 TaxID=3423406 RepID=UPI003F1E458C
MNDDEVLGAVKQTLSDVRMDRPVEAIEQRGRARRRNRGLFGVAAGGGLAAVAALSLALPMATQPPAAAPAGGGTAGGGTTTMVPAGFTLAQQPDSTVKLTLNYKKFLDPAGLQTALTDAGIPAVVKAHALCTPKGAELPQADEVYGTERIDGPDGSPKEYVLVITPREMPKNSRLYFSVFNVRGGEEFNKVGQFLVSNDDPMSCRSDEEFVPGS